MGSVSAFFCRRFAQREGKIYPARWHILVSEVDFVGSCFYNILSNTKYVRVIHAQTWKSGKS